MANLPSHTKRALVAKQTVDDGEYHVVQVDYMGKVCDVEVITPYGIYSNIPSDGIVTIWNVQGQEENRVGIGNTPTVRFKGLQPGEVVVGSPQTLSNVKFATDGSIVITGKGKAVVTIDASGNISMTTDGTVTAHSKGDMTLQSDGKLNLTSTGDMKLQGATIQLNGNTLPLSSDTTVKTN